VLFISVHSTLFGAAPTGLQQLPLPHRAPAKGLGDPVVPDVPDVPDVADGREAIKLNTLPFQILPRPGATEAETMISHQIASIINFDVDLSTEFRAMLVGWKDSIPYPDHWQGEITNIGIIPIGFLVEVKASPVMPAPFNVILSTTETYVIMNGKAFLYSLPWRDSLIPYVISAN